MSRFVDPGLLGVVAAGFAALAVGSIIRLVALRGVADPVRADRLASLRTWWMVAVLVAAVALSGRIVAVAVFTVVSGLGFHEILRLAPLSDSPDTGLFPALILMAFGYLCIGAGWSGVFPVFLPLAGLLWISTRLLGGRRGIGGVSGAARWLWGLLLVGYGVSHAPALFLLPGGGSAGAGGGGWFLFLVLVVETDDIFQALVGRAVGRRQLAPEISPQKTWEGYVGGLVLTLPLAAAVGPWITPLDVWGAVAAGFLASTLGVVGDLTISAVKREAGAKDSGTLLPGHGGVLDRIDSLIFTAPLFYYLALILS